MLGQHRHDTGWSRCRHFASQIQSLRPAVEQTRNQDATATCQAYVHHDERALKRSNPVGYKNVQSDALSVVGAHYDPDTGAVTYLTGR